MIVIVKGGLGSAFDELAINKALCDQIGVKIAGVILNRVTFEKHQMIRTYITKALARWNIPLIGSIPFNQLLSTPTMEDFEILFATKLLSGTAYHDRHFETIRLVATSLETFKERLFAGQLIVTPATREDIICCLLQKSSPPKKEPEFGLILTGRHPPLPHLIDQLKIAQLPCLYAPYPTFDAMGMITSFNAKIRKEDRSKVQQAIELVESHLNLSHIIS